MANNISNVFDIYFDKDFPRLYEDVEGGQAKSFIFSCEYGCVSHNFIQRQIPNTLCDATYYDLITAYGYGGPIIEKVVANKYSYEESKKKLIASFDEEFSRYCKDNNIVSEFIRFHPWANNAIDFQGIYDIEKIRNTIATDLENYPDFFNEEYSKGCRKNIRQAINKGVKIEIIEKPDSLESFKNIYFSTMQRNGAADYYYFDDKYFDECINLYRDNILLVNAIYEDKIIAAGFYFVWNKVVHIHLSGTLSEYLFLSPAYVLRYFVTVWANQNGYKLIHHGGGRTNDAEDNLYKFKKQFGKHTEFPFYIGKKIWNQEVYDKLSKGKAFDTSFFPAYRSR